MKQQCEFQLRGWDKRTDYQRKRHRNQGGREFCKGADNRKRKRCLSEDCGHWGRRGWAKGFCISCAQKKRYKEPQKVTKRSHHKKNVHPKKSKSKDKVCAHQAGVEVEKKIEKKPVLKKDPKDQMPDSSNRCRKAMAAQKKLCQRKEMWKLNPRPHPAADLPEDSEDSEDGVVKKDTKKDKRFSDAMVVLPNHVMEGRSPQKKRKDRAIDKRPVLVF